MDGLLVRPPILYTIIHHRRVIPMGRTSGPWVGRQLVGTFCCDLPIPPMERWTNVGAYTSVVGASVVIGGVGGLRVHSIVICTLFFCGRLHTMGRINGGNWGYGRIAGAFYCNLSYLPSGAGSVTGAQSGYLSNGRITGTFYCYLGYPPSGTVGTIWAYLAVSGRAVSFIFTDIFLPGI